jgi:hypothetical protein
MLINNEIYYSQISNKEYKLIAKEFNYESLIKKTESVNSICCVAFLGKEPIGVLCAIEYIKCKYSTILFCIAPLFYNMGIESELLSFVENICKSKNIKYLSVKYESNKFDEKILNDFFLSNNWKKPQVQQWNLRLDRKKIYENFIKKYFTDEDILKKVDSIY